MEHVDLPILPASATLSEAGEAMHRHHRSAVVTRQDGHLVVLTQDDMHRAVVAHNNRQRGPGLTLADVSPAPHLTRKPSHAHAALRHAGAPHVHTLTATTRNDETLRHAFAAEPDATVTILEYTDTIARVATAHETIARAMQQAITRGTCRAPAKDRWWAHQLIVPGICNWDNAIVDFT
jgi:hypothetical protein